MVGVCSFTIVSVVYLVNIDVFPTPLSPTRTHFRDCGDKHSIYALTGEYWGLESLEMCLLVIFISRLTFDLVLGTYLIGEDVLCLDSWWYFLGRTGSVSEHMEKADDEAVDTDEGERVHLFPVMPTGRGHSLLLNATDFCCFCVSSRIGLLLPPIIILLRI